jgi:hypothetical protein
MSLWGFLNLAVGFALLIAFTPRGDQEPVGWALVGLGVLIAAIALSRHFGRVRSKRPDVL